MLTKQDLIECSKKADAEKSKAKPDSKKSSIQCGIAKKHKLALDKFNELKEAKAEKERLGL